ncbi:hypothetical protein [Lacipirellula parvula]|uniref:Fibronectin type-III domain-containing protein n=1 Tax=Lacipirellula parvula TaxID=2650471 RepID=A0A5K7XDE6_9BACT|nr:hypothetical protein [Lacipirellula parvula]BBO34415.1 hypothetical protein PLANPX_4027 [Lacipirellula parvula]
MQFFRLIAQQFGAIRPALDENQNTPTRGRLLRLEPLESRQLLAAAGLVPIGAAPEGGLSGKIVYTRAGHGWNYYSSLGRWSTDRGNVQSIVEDFGNQDQVTMYADYLLRAGATVVPLRPVGRQINEVVLDNDSPGVAFTGTWANNASGTRWYDEDYGVGGIDAVKYRTASANGAGETAVATYTPNIPQAGLYPVYAWVSHGSDRTDQLYKINHTGGQTQITVDHRMVGNDWVYLGSYHFNSGSSAVEGSVQISNYSIGGGRSSLVVADAIRFGNGMGDLPWGSSGIGTGNVSGYPREDEGTLPWVYRGLGQGVTPSSVLGTSDVTASTRMAAHMTPSSNPFGSSLLISFHSNAGGGRGTEGLIHSTVANRTPNQQALAVMFAQQIEVDMIARNGQFPYNWSTRRDYAEGAYGEINNTWIGGKFDATIIEVGFHDSVMDSAFMRDPRGRDQMARSAYEATLEYFINFGNVKPANITLPSAPINFGVVSNAAGDVTLSWNAGLSSSGVGGVYGSPATGYRVYASVDGRGFDGGIYVAGGGTTSVTLSGYDRSIPYYFKIVAENAGGQSVGTEVLTVLPRGGAKQVLIVNGFDRHDEAQNFRYPYAFGGTTAARVWSRYNNSFDYVIQVQAAIHAARPGANVASTSNERIINGSVNLSDYDAVIWILGNESTSTSTFSAVEQTRVEQFIAAGGHLFVTGSEIGWDLDASNNGRSFYESTLKGDYIADAAGAYNVTASAGGIFAGLPLFQFSNGAAFSSLDSQMYNVQFADVIAPQAGGQLALQYSGGSNGGAGIQVPGVDGRGNVVMFGFPFEAITTAANRANVMDRVLDYFGVSAIAPANADFNGDGIVDGADFLAWQRNFGATVPPRTSGDANGDGAVDGDDLNVWRDQFGSPPPAIAAPAVVASLEAEPEVPVAAPTHAATSFAKMTTEAELSPASLNSYAPLAQHAASLGAALSDAHQIGRQPLGRFVPAGPMPVRNNQAALAANDLSPRNRQLFKRPDASVPQDAASFYGDASIDDALATEWSWLRQV